MASPKYWISTPLTETRPHGGQLRFFRFRLTCSLNSIVTKEDLRAEEKRHRLLCQDHVN
jgi:hypothetical protein